MKKIFAAVILLAIAFIITSCGPNSKYFNLGSKDYYYYNYTETNEAIELVIDPYQFIRDENTWLKKRDDIKFSNARANEPEKYYDAVVKYRKSGSHDAYQELEVKDNVIKFTNPAKDLGNNVAYEFKFHFLDKETADEKTMINYYGVFTFKKSPANAEKKTVTVTVGNEYTLLNNVVEYNGETRLSNSELAAKYTISYSVLGDSDVTIDNGKVTFTEAGAYQVIINLVSKESGSNDGTSGASTAASASSGSNDATSGASGSEDTGGSVTLTITYTINVND